MNTPLARGTESPGASGSDQGACHGARLPVLVCHGHTMALRLGPGCAGAGGRGDGADASGLDGVAGHRGSRRPAKGFDTADLQEAKALLDALAR